MLARFLLRSAALAAFALAAVAVVAPARADEEDRLFDFTDAYYLKNGVDPSKIGGRRQADGVRAVTDVPYFPFQRPVRALTTSCGYDSGGDVRFFTVMGGGSTSLFTNDAAGKKARQVADAFPEYVFPRAAADDFALGQTRQSVVLETRHGYFSKNPLGLWLHVWVKYTPAATGTSRGRKALADLAKRNGLDLDGTPIIREANEVEDLFEDGLVTKKTLPLTNGLRYAICPIIEDPTDGGIAPDAFLNYLKKADGVTPLEPQFVRNFQSLQATGRWAD